jgi:CBS domain-containing protein
MKTVKQVLDRKGSVVHSIGPEAPVFDALRRMADANVGALVVVEREEIAGLLSERDYARKVILHGKSSKLIQVREIMSRRVVCVSPQQRMDSCMALMTENRVRHLPVLEGERLVGLVSIGDVVKAIIEDQQFAIEQLEHYIRGTP